MGSTRTALAITVLAVAGLLVSVTAAWSQLTPGTSGRDQLGPPVARSQDHGSMPRVQIEDDRLRLTAQAPT
jgi:hypothetical protein